MSKKRKIISLIIFGVLVIGLVIGIILTGGSGGESEELSSTMRDAVLHESNKVAFFGLEVNPGLIAGYLVTGIILLFALIVRIFVIPHFKEIPGKFQFLLETWVGYFSDLGEQNAPKRAGKLGAYLFIAGSYIFVSTVFELIGVQWVTTEGLSISLPAPLSDINGAISVGCLSYLFIMAGGIRYNKARGLGKTLKDFSLPISMSFRIFGALLSGALVTELVYSTIKLSFVLPVVIGVLFTLLHALIQAYVLTMLVAYFYGEVTEPHKKVRKVKKIKEKTQAAA